MRIIFSTLLIIQIGLLLSCCGNSNAIPVGNTTPSKHSEVTVLETEQVSDGTEVRYIDHGQYRIFLYGNGVEEAGIQVVNLKKDSLEEELLKLQIEKLKQ